MTRMWVGVEPTELCDQHLLGEHKEMHQEVGTWLNHPHGEAVVAGHVRKLQVIPSYIEARHGVLAREMLDRGMKHVSPLPRFEWREMPEPPEHDVDKLMAWNRRDLADRCNDCQLNLHR